MTRIRPRRRARSLLPLLGFVGIAQVATATGTALQRVELAMERYHRRDLDGAWAALESAGPVAQSDARLHLYSGLIQLQRGAARPAARSLERARELDARRVEPVASYYAGVAWANEGERVLARAHLERVRSEWPGTLWSSEAERVLGRLEAQRATAWFGTLEAGLELDSNVVLRGAGVALPGEVSRQEDGRGAWNLRGGVSLFPTSSWSAGLLGSYAGTGNFQLSDFDTHYPALSAWATRRLGSRDALRAQYGFGFAWVGGDPFLEEHEWSLALLHRWNRAGRSRLTGAIQLSDYRFEALDIPGPDPAAPGSACAPSVDLCGPAGLDERAARGRDGHGWRIGVAHTWPLPGADATATTGYHYRRFDAEGTEYAHAGHELALDLAAALPLEADLAVGTSLGLLDFDHPTTFPDPADLVAGVPYTLDDDDRRDHAVRVYAELGRPLRARLRVSARWDFVRNFSNADVFEHDRHVVGVFLATQL